VALDQSSNLIVPITVANTLSSQSSVCFIWWAAQGQVAEARAVRSGRHSLAPTSWKPVRTRTPLQAEEYQLEAAQRGSSTRAATVRL
jgi:hypothetical protein